MSVRRKHLGGRAKRPPRPMLGDQFQRQARQGCVATESWAAVPTSDRWRSWIAGRAGREWDIRGEVGVEERGQMFQSIGGIWSVHLQIQLSTGTSGQGEQVEDTFRVDLFPGVTQPNAAVEAFSRLRQERTRPHVETVFGLNRDAPSIDLGFRHDPRHRSKRGLREGIHPPGTKELGKFVIVGFLEQFHDGGCRR